MSIEVLSGSGKLLDGESRRPVAEIKYQIKFSPSTEVAEETSHGDFTVSKDLGLDGDYIVELADGRRGGCLVSRGLKSMSGMPAVFRYNFGGTTALA